MKGDKEARIREALPMLRKEANRRNPPNQRAAEAVSLKMVNQLVKDARREKLSRGERRVLDIFTIAFVTMSRVGEISTLRVEDVAPNGDTILIRPKTGARTWLKLTKRVSNVGGLRAAERLEEYRKRAIQEGRELLFTGKKGKQLTTASITARLKQVGRKLRVYSRITAHSARKGAAVEALLAGVPLPVIQALGGWRDINTLQAYIGEAVRRAVPLMEILEARRGQKAGKRERYNGCKSWLEQPKWRSRGPTGD